MATATTSTESVLEVTSSDQTDNNLEGNNKTFCTFGFDVKTQKADLTLIFGINRLFVKKSILEDASPVFEKLFDEKLSDKTPKELTVDDISCKDFAEFLACIQPRGKHKITPENVYRMLEIASKYEVEDLIDRCEDCLLDVLKGVGKEPKPVLMLMKRAYENNLVSLKSACMEKVNIKVLDILQEEKSTPDRSLELRYDLFEKFLPDLVTQSYMLEYLKTTLTGVYSERLEEFKRAKGLEIKLKVKLDSCFTQKISLWGINLNVKVGYNDILFGWRLSVITLEIEDNAKLINFTSQVGIACKICNFLPKMADIASFKIFNCPADFSSGNDLHWDFTNDKGIDGKNLNDGSLGFMYGDMFTVELYFLMNEPQYK